MTSTSKTMGWTRDEMAERAAQDIPDGSYVNLGIGIPELVASHVPEGREFIYHTENGLLGMGPSPAGDGEPDLINAGQKRVTALPGAAVAGLPEVPPHMRGTLIGMVHVLCRIRNESPELETPAQLRSYLQGECDGLLAKLAGEFWAVEHFERGEDGEPRWVGKELRESYRVKRG